MDGRLAERHPLRRKAVNMDAAPTANRTAAAPRRSADWLLVAIGVMFVFNLVPFLAPVFMQIGWEVAGRVIYTIYSALCHQMAQRSFFLFGPGGFQMYGLDQLPVDSSGPMGILNLRAFVGTPEMGWKVAWSDRIVYMYTAPLLAALVYAILRRRGPVRPLSLWVFFALLLPMAIDGGTHMISDLGGLGHGFRETNAWLAQLTNHALPPQFYDGDGLGSFNSLMRLISGLSFGFGLGWLVRSEERRVGKECRSRWS